MTDVTTLPADDARVRVRTALRTLVRAGPLPRPGAEGVWRNLLLDAVGSDHRALVDLLLFAATRHVPEALPPGPLPLERWEALQARIALDFAARTFVRIDAARWAVEAWAFALGTIDAPQLEEQRLAADRAAAALATAPSPGQVPAAGTTPRRSPRTPLPPTRRSAASPAASVVGRAAARVLPPGPRWRVAANASPHQTASLAPAQVARLVAVVVALVGGPALVLLQGPLRGPGASLEPSSPAGGGSAAPRESTAAVGRPDADGAAPSPAPTLLPQSVATIDDRTAAIDPRPARERGIGGRYRVELTGLEVAGSASCDLVARRIATRQATIESIDHAPGAPRLVFASRRALSAELAPDGHFETPVVEGTTDGVHWRVRLAGVAAGDSLVAISESETAGVLRWRDAQQCRVLTRLVWHRLPATLAGRTEATP